MNIRDPSWKIYGEIGEPEDELFQCARCKDYFREQMEMPFLELTDGDIKDFCSLYCKQCYLENNPEIEIKVQDDLMEFTPLVCVYESW